MCQIPTKCTKSTPLAAKTWKKKSTPVCRFSWKYLQLLAKTFAILKIFFCGRQESLQHLARLFVAKRIYICSNSKERMQHQKIIKIITSIMTTELVVQARWSLDIAGSRKSRPSPVIHDAEEINIIEADLQINIHCRRWIAPSWGRGREVRSSEKRTWRGTTEEYRWMRSKPSPAWDESRGVSTPYEKGNKKW